MRILTIIRLPHETFNDAVRDGSIGGKMQAILEATKPEATYFTEIDGIRCAVLISELESASAIPALSEPWFLTFEADVEHHVVMSPEDLAAAGLEAIGERWG